MLDHEEAAADHEEQGDDAAEHEQTPGHPVSLGIPECGCEACMLELLLSRVGERFGASAFDGDGTFGLEACIVRTPLPFIGRRARSHALLRGAAFTLDPLGFVRESSRTRLPLGTPAILLFA